MTKSHILIRSKEPRLKAASGLRFLSGLLLGLALAGAVFAQENTETRITTLLPSSTASECKQYDPKTSRWELATDKSNLVISDAFGNNTKKVCYLEFSIESIPDKATITSAVLRIVQKGVQPNTSTLLINVASIPKGDWTKNLAEYEDKKKNFFLGVIRSETAGSDTVDALKQVAGTSSSLLRSEANKKYVALLLSPSASGSGRNYYPATGDTTNAASHQPRLILTYTVPRLSTPRSPVSQSDGWAAMRSPRTFMPVPNVPAQDNYKAMQVVDGTKISSYTAALYGGLTYVVQKYPTQANSFKWHLDAQEPLGRVVWSMPLPSELEEKARVVVNDSGRLTIVNRARFIVYQLNTDDPRKQPANPLKDVSAVPGVKTPAALLPATDGSLYVIDDTDLYALNPDLQMLWKTGIGTSADARMTLSPDGQFVYATALLPGEKDERKPTFLAINAQTGKTTSMPFPNETKAFHDPVVIRHTGGADYIYIAANSQNNGVLQTVSNVPNEETGDRIAKLTPVNKQEGLFSQPAPDSAVLPAGADLSTKKLYVLWKENNNAPVRLVSINGQTGKIDEPKDATTITDSQNKNAAFADGSWLWKGGDLALDASDNVFFWENGTLYGYQTKPSASKLFAWTQEKGSGGSPPHALPEKLELLFGSDGTLFAQKSETGAFALIPTYNLPTTEASISSPTNLRVDGTVTTNNTVRAQGSVLLGNGFTVSKNVTFEIKKPYPWLPADIVGTYRREPRANDWHEGSIRFRGDNLVWENKAGASWNLIPDPENGVLKTDDTNPYFAETDKFINYRP